VKSKYYEKKEDCTKSIICFTLVKTLDVLDVMYWHYQIMSAMTIHLYQTIALKFKGKNLKTLEFPLIQDEQENIIATLL
jgi:hypothetical protein